MIDPHGRTLSYLRLSVTDRCNMRCDYCMPPEGVTLLGHDDVLSFEEIVAVVRAGVALGVTKVRLTGGEPLVRRGIVDLVAAIAGIEGIVDLAMTTNGALLGQFAGELAAAGLGRVNVSLDTLDEDRFAAITHGGDLQAVLAGIDAAVDARLTPVKLNCVVGPDTPPSDPQSVRQFGLSKGLAVRTIRLMDFQAGYFSVVEGGSGGDCQTCNRLRLSSDGHIRPCLFSDIALNVRQLGPSEALRQAAAMKPEVGGPCSHNWMHGIGG